MTRLILILSLAALACGIQTPIATPAVRETAPEYHLRRRPYPVLVVPKEPDRINGIKWILP